MSGPGLYEICPLCEGQGWANGQPCPCVEEGVLVTPSTSSEEILRLVSPRFGGTAAAKEGVTAMSFAYLTPREAALVRLALELGHAMGEGGPVRVTIDREPVG